MLRRAALQRSAPLVARTPLVSKTPLAARSALAAGKGLTRAVRAPKPRRDTGPTQATRDLVRARAGDCCERCGIPLRGGGNHHHRLARGMGGTRDEAVNSAANILSLCGSGTTGCHGWVESHRREALLEGWLVPRTADPAGAPVRLHGIGWALLKADGTYDTLTAYRAD